MTKRANPNDRLLTQALANGAEVVGEAPKAKPPRAAPHHTGEFVGRLMKCAALGWGWIETRDGLSYRWRTAGGACSPWGSYEDVTKITTGPAL